MSAGTMVDNIGRLFKVYQRYIPKVVSQKAVAAEKVAAMGSKFEVNTQLTFLHSDRHSITAELGVKLLLFPYQRGEKRLRSCEGCSAWGIPPADWARSSFSSSRDLRWPFCCLRVVLPTRIGAESKRLKLFAPLSGDIFYPGSECSDAFLTLSLYALR